MTNKELQEELKKYDDDVEIIINDNSGGSYDPSVVILLHEDLLEIG